jgi:hypothetical protein
MLVYGESSRFPRSEAAGRPGSLGRFEAVVGLAQHLIRISPLLGVLQNDTAPMTIDNAPFFDLLQRSKAAEAGKVIA